MFSYLCEVLKWYCMSRNISIKGLPKVSQIILCPLGLYFTMLMQATQPIIHLARTVFENDQCHLHHDDMKLFATKRHWNDLANCCAGAGLAEPVLSMSLVRWFSIARFPVFILFQVVCHGYTNTDAPSEWRTGSLRSMCTSLKTKTFSCSNTKTQNICAGVVPRHSHYSNMLLWLFKVSYTLSVTIT